MFCALDNAEGGKDCTYEGGIKTSLYGYDLARKTGIGCMEAAEKLRKIEDSA
jgi:hypothetical protein